MSLGSTKHQRREEALEAARRRLRRLEIETHRIKAELARLEAEYEDDVADWLSRKLRRRSTPSTTSTAPESRADSAHIHPLQGRPAIPHDGRTDEAAVLPFTASVHADGASRRVDETSHHKAKASKLADKSAVFPAHNFLPPPVLTGSDDIGAGAHRRNRQPGAALRRQATKPIMVSLGLHAVVLFLCFTLTFATVVQQVIPLFASPDFVDDAPAELSEIEIAASKFEDDELKNVVAESPDFNVSDNMLHELEPEMLGAGTRALGDIGQLDALPSELGTLMAGAGSPGSGPPGGELGTAVFFGARSKGDRFVFVVDNSSSMKGGRLEAAVAELTKSVDALSPRQSFYVIFVSDQTYPMFYPVAAPGLLPATAPNKQRLAQWLPKAILASGKNREIIKAMDMAAALRPHAVFLLWDGDLKYSEKVRLDVMTHLTRPGQWNFTIHTLGMGVASLDAEYNLTAIAKANGGTFQRVDVPPPRNR